MKAAFLAVLAAALVAGATARAPLSTRSLLWGCGLDNYCCVSSDAFCLGGKVMKCADGTHCETQPLWRRESHSPCVSASSGAGSGCEGADCGGCEGDDCAEGSDAPANNEEGGKWHEAILIWGNWEECPVDYVPEGCDEQCQSDKFFTLVEPYDAEASKKKAKKEKYEITCEDDCPEWEETICEDDSCLEEIACDGDCYEEINVEECEDCPKECAVPSFICVSDRHFCLGDKVMQCAAGTVCSSWYFLQTGNSPCVWPWQA